MRRLAVAQLGSAGALDEKEFASRVVDYAIRISTAVAADTAAVAADTAAAAARDKSLSEYAEAVVQILIAMKAPGCQWLPLTEE